MVATIKSVRVVVLCRMRLVHSGESSAASDSLTGSTAQAAERLLQAGAGLGIALYAGGLVLGAVDLATLGVVIGVSGAVGNLLLGALRRTVGNTTS